MIAMVKDWFNKYPIFSWEDPLQEEDWEGFKHLMAETGKKELIVGDDLFGNKFSR